MLFSFSIRSRMDSSPAYSPDDSSLLQHLLFLLCVCFCCWFCSFIWYACACVCVGGGGRGNRVDTVPWV